MTIQHLTNSSYPRLLNALQEQKKGVTCIAVEAVFNFNGTMRQNKKNNDTFIKRSSIKCTMMMMTKNMK